MRTVLVDPARCVGCRQCELACAVAHSASKDLTRALAEWPPPRARIHVEAGPVSGSAFPNRCRHCEPAPCLAVCPTGALGRDPDERLVLVDAGRCIACAMCAIVCPFAALTFHPAAAAPTHSESPVATKCDGCIERLRAGDEPACVEVCKTGALLYGEINTLIRADRAALARRTLAAAAAVPPPVAYDAAAPGRGSATRRGAP